MTLATRDGKRRGPSEARAGRAPRAGRIRALSEVAESGKPACACGGGCPRCKLEVGAADHPAEREADRMAQAMLRPGAEAQWPAALAGVRVHTGEEAAASAQALGARAYAQGDDIVFGRGEYAPHTGAGRQLLAHELAHVAQSRASPQGTPALRRKPLVIEHSDGDKFEVPGLTAEEAEFGASGKTSSLLAPAKKLRGARPIQGGFKADLDVDIAFATGVETAADKDLKALVKSAGKRIDARVLPALRSAATDRFVLEALKSFLETDKGTIEAWESGGHYDGDHSPPTLSIGIGEGEFETRKTLVHELLHYVFDRTDSVLGESMDAGGADHDAIEALETRFMIVDLIRSGKPPLHDKFASKFGEYLKGDDLFVKMREAIAKDDRKGLKALAARSDFVKISVSSGIMPTASKLAFKATGDDYRYTADQFRDLAFLWAQNAAIVRHAMRSAVAVAERSKTPLKDVFASAEWRKEMSAFLEAFVKGLRKDRTKGVVSLEAGL